MWRLMLNKTWRGGPWLFYLRRRSHKITCPSPVCHFSKTCIIRNDLDKPAHLLCLLIIHVSGPTAPDRFAGRHCRFGSIGASPSLHADVLLLQCPIIVSGLFPFFSSLQYCCGFIAAMNLSCSLLSATYDIDLTEPWSSPTDPTQLLAQEKWGDAKEKWRRNKGEMQQKCSRNDRKMTAEMIERNHGTRSFSSVFHHLPGAKRKERRRTRTIEPLFDFTAVYDQGEIIYSYSIA